MRHIGGKVMMAALCLSSAFSCINEDLSDCGHTYKVEYDVKLTTSLQTELEAVLETIEEKELGQILKDSLGKVFTDQAHDVDLRFYQSDSSLFYKEHHVIDNNSASYTIFLPVQNYHHLALANDDVEPNVRALGLDRAPNVRWEQVREDTINSYEIGLFSARLRMSVEDKNQTFFVKMYMQNAAAALVVDQQGYPVKSIRAVMAYLADGFSVRDSVYSFHDQTVIRTKDLGYTGSALKCFYGVGFASRDEARLNAPKLERGQNVSEQEEGAIWEVRAYVTLPDGKVTETRLHVKRPLKAGQLKIVNTLMDADGRLIPKNKVEVGASVELDWKEGGSFNPEI